MLILTRKTGEAIVIGEEITIRVLEVKGGQAKIGVEAPGHVAVHRQEIFERIMEENKKAAQDAPADLDDLAAALPSRPGGNPEQNR